MKNAKWEEIWADALTLCFMQDVKIHAVAVSNVLDAAMLIPNYCYYVLPSKKNIAF